MEVLAKAVGRQRLSKGQFTARLSLGDIQPPLCPYAAGIGFGDRIAAFPTVADEQVAASGVLNQLDQLLGVGRLRGVGAHQAESHPGLPHRVAGLWGQRAVAISKHDNRRKLPVAEMALQRLQRQPDGTFEAGAAHNICIL